MLPEAFLHRMEQQLGEEYPAFLASLERPRAVALRLNPLKKPFPGFNPSGAPVPWEPMGYYYDEGTRPGLHPYHEAGVYYLQEASAMSPVALLDPQPGERICDLCAAPGGKTTQIAGRMGGQGFLLCNEINPKRAKVLSRNMERMGVANALVTNGHPADLANRFPGFFDRVLVDAPCSGEGMFRKEEAAVTDWSPETVEMCARRQAEILDSAARLLAPGGRLVYSTCTFSPQENEETVAAFLTRHPEFQPETGIQAPWFTPGENGSFRMWPHKLLGEGHFAAVLRKMEGAREIPPEEPGIPLPKEFLAFAQEQQIALPEGKGIAFGDSLFWAPTELPRLRGLKVLRPGLELGTMQKGRFLPAHALALWLDGGTGVQLPPEGEEIRRYLHGEVLPGGEKGWRLICAGAYSLGWAKGDGTVLKNHYPKGLRR